MIAQRTEAIPIARLIGRDPMKTIGLLYHWNTGEVTVLWLSRKRAVHFIEPPVEADRFCPNVGANREVLAHLSAGRARSVLSS